MARNQGELPRGAGLCAGTLVLTGSGDRPVESVRSGDVVVAAGGTHRTVRRVERRHCGARALWRNPALRPVRLRAGSLSPVLGGPVLPRRDLLVSPGHLVLLDGVLVAAVRLVNGTTIGRDPRGSAYSGVDYHLLELDDHDAILAEGVPFGTVAGNGAAFCAPVLEGGFHLQTILQRLAAAARSRDAA